MFLKRPTRGSKQEENVYRMVNRFLGLAFLLPLCVFIGYVFGKYLDRAFGTNFLYIVFLLLGVAAGIIELLREINKSAGSDTPDDASRGN
jgi:F0F1-type ATP synthase assembly protein I